MSQNDVSSLDLNLFRVLIAVADTGSVTSAARQLYLTQSAVSAALRRLQDAIGAPLTARQGRGIALTERGARLVIEVRPHLAAMVTLALSPARFDPRTSERTFKLGLSDAADEWLLPPLLRHLARAAPRMRLICMPTHFRTVGQALALRNLDVAVTHADDLPQSIVRAPLVRGRFVCLFDPRMVKLGARPSVRTYLAQDHVIVSYNGDLRGVVEEAYGVERRIRCSVASFAALGAIVDGSALVASVPEMVARPILAQRRHLRSARFPFDHPEGGVDLLWPKALDGDDACAFMRDAIMRVARTGRS